MGVDQEITFGREVRVKMLNEGRLENNEL